MENYPKATRIEKGELFATLLSRALNDGLYGIAAQMIADEIDGKTTLRMQMHPSILAGLRVTAEPPAAISEEPAPDEHRDLLSLIRDILVSQRDLMGHLQIELAGAKEPMSDKYKEMIRYDINYAEGLRTRANAILAEHDALDVAPEHSDEDNA